MLALKYLSLKSTFCGWNKTSDDDCDRRTHRGTLAQCCIHFLVGLLQHHRMLICCGFQLLFLFLFFFPLFFLPGKMSLLRVHPPGAYISKMNSPQRFAGVNKREEQREGDKPNNSHNKASVVAVDTVTTPVRTVGRKLLPHYEHVLLWKTS